MTEPRRPAAIVVADVVATRRSSAGPCSWAHAQSVL